MLRFAILMIILLGLFAIVPPMFTIGGTFYQESIEPLNMDRIVRLENGDLGVIKGLYFDNVYFVLLYLTLSVLGLYLPFIFDLNSGIKRVFKYISFFVGAWFTTILLTELINLYYPEIVINSSDEPGMNFQILFLFIVGLAFTFTQELWIRQKKYEK